MTCRIWRDMHVSLGRMTFLQLCPGWRHLSMLHVCLVAHSVALVRGFCWFFSRINMDFPNLCDRASPFFWKGMRVAGKNLEVSQQVSPCSSDFICRVPFDPPRPILIQPQHVLYHTLAKCPCFRGDVERSFPSEKNKRNQWNPWEITENPMGVSLIYLDASGGSFQPAIFTRYAHCKDSCHQLSCLKSQHATASDNCCGSLFGTRQLYVGSEFRWSNLTCGKVFVWQTRSGCAGICC